MPHDSRSTTIVLASGSPRRKELLGRLNVPFLVDPGDFAERPPEPGEDPAEYALALAREKASAGAQRHPGAIVVGADTVVTIAGHILGKPRDDDYALKMLELLEGKCHRVITAVAVCVDSSCRSDAKTSRVCMKSLSNGELLEYVLTGETRDKAGAYAVQGQGRRLVERVSGCINNVVGLPLCLTKCLLTDFGLTLNLPKSADPHVTSGTPI